MTETITESRQVTLTEALDTETGLFELMLLTPGLGSSGYYAPTVVEAAGTSEAFPKGTHLYLDHPTMSEEHERPERSVRDLAGVLTESARWNGEGLVAKAKVYSTYRPLLAEAAPDIGMSIRASAEVSEGEHEGQRTRIVERIDSAISVDFVTRPGRGGAVLAVLESARAIEAGTLNSDMHERLNRAVQAAHGGDSGGGGATSYVRDFDDTLVYFVRYSEDNPGTFQQSYSSSDDEITLTGDPVEVRAETTYVPVDPAVGTTTEESTMTPEEQARMAQLEEAAGRAEQVAAENAVLRARDAARLIAAQVVGESTTLRPVTVARVVESVVASPPLTEDGTLDEAALRTAAESARTAAESEIADYPAATGTGRVNGFGEPAEPTLTETQRPPSRAFGRVPATTNGS